MELTTFLRRHALLAGTCALLSCLVALGALRTLPDTYESFASVYVMSSDEVLDLFHSVFKDSNLTRTDDRQGYVLAVLHSRQAKTTVIGKLDKELQEQFWEGAPADERTREDGWNRMAEYLRIDDATLGEPIVLHVTTEKPALSHALAKAYLELLMARIDNDTRSQEKFLKERLETARSELSAATKRFQIYQELNALPFTLEAQGQADIAKLTELHSDYAKAEVELKATEKQLQAPGDLASQLALASQKAGYEARAAVLKQMLDEQAGKLASMPDKINQYDNLKRAIDEKAKVVQSLSEQYELAKFQITITTTPYRVIDKPLLPERPVEKPYLAVGLGGALLGSILGLFLALLREPPAVA